MEKLRNVIDNKLCVSCGFCDFYSKKKLDFNFRKETELFEPKIDDANFDPKTFCPSINIDMVKNSIFKFNKSEPKSILGFYKKLYYGFSNDKKTRFAGASGGIAQEICKFLLDEKIVDEVYTTIHSNYYKKSRGIKLTKAQNLTKISGSIYHGANYSSIIRKIKNTKKKFAFIGLPCQILALQEIKMHNKEILKKNVITIGLFCGGLIKPSGFKYYLKNFYSSEMLKKIKNLRYREKPWPGSFRVEFTKKKSELKPRLVNNSRLNIIRYMIAEQFNKNLRCKFCPDQLSDFADISIGDPHFSKYSKDAEGGSFIITRTTKGLEIMNKIQKKIRVSLFKASEKEIIDSQATLKTRRYINTSIFLSKFFLYNTPKVKNYEKYNKNFKFDLYLRIIFSLLKSRLGFGFLVRKFVAYPLQIVEYLFFMKTSKSFLRKFYEIILNKKVIINYKKSEINHH